MISQQGLKTPAFGRLRLTAVMALLLFTCAFGAAAADVPQEITVESATALPRLPGGLILAGAASDGAGAAWAPFTEINTTTTIEAADAGWETPGSLAALVQLIVPDTSETNLQVRHESWRADVAAGTAVVVDVVIQTDDSGTERLFALQMRTEGDVNAAQVRLIGAAASVGADADVAAVVPLGNRESLAAGATAGSGAVALLTSPDASGHGLARGADLSLVGHGAEGAAPVRLETLVVDVSAGGVVILGAPSELWSTAPTLQLAESLVQALAGEPVRGRLVTAGATNRDTVLPGDRLRYTLRAGNVGAAPATDIATSLPLPVQLALDADTLHVSAGTVSWDATANRFAWVVDRVPVGGVVVLTYEAVVR